MNELNSNLGGNSLSENDIRKNKLQLLVDAGINPFAEKYNRTSSIDDIQELPDTTSMNEARNSENDLIQIGGRLMNFRSHGKLSFAKLKDVTGEIQLAFTKGDIVIDKGNGDIVNELNIGGENIDAYKFLQKYIDIGDIIGVNGNLFYTQKGEKTLFVKEIMLLTKTINSLPEKHHGLQDTEERFRKRYLDILLNSESKELIERRSLYFKAIRDFLNQKGFMEVDTPILETTTGGADAAPFKTHHNAYDMDTYLRISAGELWQKRLMVAGFEKIYELGRVFRNEGVSTEHAQDYNQVEVYWAYSDYKDMMNLVKEMYLSIIDNVYKKREFDIRGFNVNFDTEWGEIDYTEIIKEKTGIDIFKSTDDEILVKINELGIKVDSNNRMRMIDYLWKSIRKTIPGPAFLINEPKFMSPLAKSDTINPEITHRFHVIIAGSEVGNGYSELNDPIDQEERFVEQQKLRDAGDDEAQMADFDFVEALKYGMPPTVGFGVSERFFAFLEGKPIRECQTFPLMKPF
ncbi:MAG: lysine--tRNA ligase [Candidatus Gracilibacteria bacterium]